MLVKDKQMTDTLNPERRSELMSRIQGGLACNSLERTVHNWLNAKHIHHEMNPKCDGLPDARVETRTGPIFLFIDGCFWHVCPIHYRRPRSNVEFWRPHLERRNQTRELLRKNLGYRWVRIWEHQIRDGSYKEILIELIGSERRFPRPPKSIQSPQEPLNRGNQVV